MDNSVFDALLTSVEKPARYMGGELNSIYKQNALFSFALCFPDVYEIGMSHLGSRILYNVLNKRDDTFCERVFTPWVDMERKLRDCALPLFSIETRKPLNEFDIIGFSLLYEMSYTNILTMLDLSGIPFYSRDRGEEHPIIMCGGPCACNPEPIADFMDVVVIGDGEEVVNDIMDVYAACRRDGMSKRDTLLAMAHIDGVYLPSMYEPVYEHGRYTGTVPMCTSVPATTVRRVLRNLDGAEYVGKLIVPFMAIVHDRIALELFRGCTRGCRFCQAGFVYRPLRERSVETLMDSARSIFDCTGYDEISLFSLSSGDYSAIHELVPAIVDEFSGRNVSIALPSLRIDSYLKQDLEKIRTVRKTGLTLAPEAGTQRLRDVINKGVSEADLLRSVRDAFESGWTSVKLYFMIGLPTETDEDIRGIADLARKVTAEFYSLPKNSRGKGLKVTVSVSTFVPKPFTPFQWDAQISPIEIRRRQLLLKEALRGMRSVEYQYHDSATSVLEAVFARGDRRLARVIEGAYKRGARLDSWDECFNADAYAAAFEAEGISTEEYAARVRSTDEVLPWDHIDMLVKKSYLVRERDKASRAETTRDCRMGCNGCFGDKYEDYCKVL
ncbi:MAG: TIGR03960 family B12-binding radical SAM protein [Clostridia bacterium]|nr:TIGR03960 family B12-binding radical SAM protein [Clostridia bacterium]